MLEKIIDLYGYICQLYWYSTERKIVKSEGREDTTFILPVLRNIDERLNDIALTDFNTIHSEVKAWIKICEENYDFKVMIEKDDKKKLDEESNNWRKSAKSILMKRIADLKDITDIQEELRSHRELLINIPESYKSESDIGEVKNLLKNISSSNISLLISSPVQRTFEPKIRGICNSTKTGPVYMAGYFDQDMLPVLIELSKNVELRIISPELQKSRQDEINKDALERLHKEGVIIKFHRMLHARYIVTQRELIVGSADIKSDCLGGRRYDLCIWSNNPLMVEDLLNYSENLWGEAKLMF